MKICNDAGENCKEINFYSSISENQDSIQAARINYDLSIVSAHNYQLQLMEYLPAREAALNGDTLISNGYAQISLKKSGENNKITYAFPKTDELRIELKLVDFRNPKQYAWHSLK